jgi:hypothetical protein
MASVTCVGIQEYTGFELQALVDSGTALDTNKVYRVFRPGSTVFADETKHSLKLKPITDNHPHTFVDSSNYSGFSIGSTGDSVFPIDDQRLGVTVVFTNNEAIEKINKGTHQLSAGYSGHVSMQQGSYNGSAYDAVWDSPMIINHIALASTYGGGRCGNGATILDNKPKEVNNMPNDRKKVEDMDMGGLVAQVTEKLMPQMQELLQSDDFQNKLADTLAAKLGKSMQGGDGDNGDGDFVEAADVDGGDTDTVQTPAAPAKSVEQPVANDKQAIDGAVAQRFKVVDMARTIKSDVATDGKSNLEIMQDAMGDIMGDEVKGKTLDYLMGVAQSASNTRAQAADYLKNISNGASDVFSPRNIHQLKLNNIIQR